MSRQSILLIVAGLLVAAGGGFYWWHQHRSNAQPSSIVQANGRLELARIDVAVKYPGRIVELRFREGERVQPGQVLARQDDSELKAQLAAARAQRARASSAISRATAELGAHRTGEQLARLELTETQDLYRKELVSDVEVQRRELALAAETSSVAAANAALTEAHTAMDEADAGIARLDAVLDETLVRAPVAGRVEYKVIESGAVLAPGGRVATLLDPTDVYMTLFVPTEVAGRLKVGDEARIVLDSFEVHALPATISFVSPEAQFTPKFVETASERATLMYRVKLQIPTAVAAQYDGQLKAGATGNGYLRLDSGTQWPAALAIQTDGAPR